MTADWNPALYSAFRGPRLRPALDLMAQVGELPDGAVVDLGCGDGAAAAALRARFAGRALLGVDASPTMLEKAQGYDGKALADIADWQPEAPAALIFSNAALQWLAGHAQLLPRLAGLLAPEGRLAVQMPRNHMAPSHVLLRQTADRLFPGRFPPYVLPVGTPQDYWAILAPLGPVTIWETEYLQQLGPASQGHPVRNFTQSTAMRGFMDRLDPEEGAVLTAAYDEALAQAYPLLPDGGALFPFRRLFLILQRPN